ncbi:MAG TPA: hypothetical protein VK711_18150, partial [Puia sp.]|nr:hypothetical protein [Puia sp.]
MKFILILIPFLFVFRTHAQTNIVNGRVEDSITHEVLSGASILIYGAPALLGGISNPQGNFLIHTGTRVDSVKFSVIGYQTKIFRMSEFAKMPFTIVRMVQSHPDLQEIVVHPISALDIVKRAAQKIQSFNPPNDFESKVFYREIIRDSLQYYSVAEAIFRIQFSVEKKSFKLKMDKGRSKEDVAFTRLFEDFHPGGGPEDITSQSFVVQHPDFLTIDNLNKYIFKKDSTIQDDDQFIYIISFDQRPNVKEALEKGKIYIDANDFSILKYEAENSPLGNPYIKSLKGTDKIFAELLHIDLAIKRWARTVTYTKIADKVFLSYAKMEYNINFKQPKKNLDLDLFINTELLVTDIQHPIINEISKAEEWKRKNLVANLPSDFDSAFWGTDNIVSSTSTLNDVIASISKKNQDLPDTATLEGWQYFNKEYFVAGKKGDSIRLVPLVKCSWEDNEKGGMIYKMVNGDFNVEARLSITKRSNSREDPDNGFQQTGIIIRSAAGKNENNFIFSMGTGGNDIPKYFLRRTTDGRTKSQAEKTDRLSGWLRIEKRGKMITAFNRPDEKSPWKKMDEYSSDWLYGDLEVGLSIMARFAGNGPKQHP